MRTKTQAFKDNLNFYHTFLHLNPPYPILMDGSFILSIIANEVDDIEKYLKDRFGCTFSFYTTKCVQFDLECKFPNDYQINDIMEKVKVYQCSTSSHSCTNSAASLSVAEIGTKNLLKRECGPPKNHQYVRSPDPRFIIAMKDGLILEQLRKVAGVPLMYFDGGDLYLERPSDATLNWVSNIKFRNLGLLELEREILQRALEDDDVIPCKDDDHAKELKTAKYELKSRTKGEGDQSSQRTWKTDQNSNTSCEENKKLKRDLSPDICDLPPGLSKGSRAGTSGVKLKAMKKFEVYRTLFWDFNQPDSTALQGVTRSSRKMHYSLCSADPTDLLTDTSTFEFGSEGEKMEEK